MAKNKSSFSGMADGLFSEEVEMKTTEEMTVGGETRQAQTSQRKTKAAGRPRASDLQPGEDVLKTSIYLTEETAILIDVYSAKNRIDRSEAIRKLIREYAK